MTAPCSANPTQNTVSVVTVVLQYIMKGITFPKLPLPIAHHSGAGTSGYCKTPIAQSLAIQATLRVLKERLRGTSSEECSKVKYKCSANVGSIALPRFDGFAMLLSVAFWTNPNVHGHKLRLIVSTTLKATSSVGVGMVIELQITFSAMLQRSC
eukprot:1727740-Amphidinium_carterae.1